MRQSWRSSLVILEWGVVARGCIPPALIILLFSQYYSWTLWLLHHDTGGELLYRHFAEAQLHYFVDWGAAALILLAVGLLLHYRHIESMLFQHITANFYGVALVWAGYCSGTLSFAAGATLMGAPLMGFILMDRRVVVLAFLISLLSLLALSLAAAFGLIPYAPYFVPPHSGASALLWVDSHLFFVLPHLLVNLLVAPMVLGQWHRREAEALRLSLTDALTGVHNRRSIITLLNKELARSRRYGRPLAIAILDLDHFKRINDLWGHPTGDTVLRETVAVLKSCIRQCDAIGRFGGEEFLLLLPDTNREGAVQGIERCRAKMAALKLMADNGTAIPVSASFGITCTDIGFEPTADMLIIAADAALYRAKQGGRNQTVLAERSAPGPAQVTSAARRPLCEAGETRINVRPGCHTMSLLHALGDLQAWRKRLAGVLEWTPVAKVGLVLAIMANMYATFLVWLGLVLHSQDRAQIINMTLVPALQRLVLAFLCGALLLVAVSLPLRRWQPQSVLFQHVGLQYCGLTAAGLGYMIGILSAPTGIILVGLLLAGFILFEGVVALCAFLTQLAAIVLIAYSCALGYMPYAPLIAAARSAYQFCTPVWVLGDYLFVSFVLLVVFVLVDHVLGHWREREADVRNQSLTDALTGVHNRRSIIGLLEKEVARTIRHGPPLAVVLLDLDHFKSINDKWGHPTGDRVLRLTAQTLSAVVRGCDVIGRFGGEEFMIVLQDTSMTGAVALVERCRAALAASRIESESGEVFCISASFGLASNERCLELTAEVLIKAADAALYRAKAGGRNRIEAVAVAANI